MKYHYLYGVSDEGETVVITCVVGDTVFTQRCVFPNSFYGVKVESVLFRSMQSPDSSGKFTVMDVALTVTYHLYDSGVKRAMRNPSFHLLRMSES